MKMNIGGNLGYYLDDNNVITFQIGNNPYMNMEDSIDPTLFPLVKQSKNISYRWLNVGGYNIYTRGLNNNQAENIETNIKANRLLPSLINKQVKMLYGKGPAIYREQFSGNKLVKEWVNQP